MAAYEVMLATPAIRNLIREGKSFQIQSMIQTSKKLGMQAMDDAIYDLYMQNKISAEDACKFCTGAGSYAAEGNAILNCGASAGNC